MIVHIVSFKYKADVSAAARQEHRDRLGALRALDGYQADHRHVPVAQLGVASCDHIVSVDFAV